MRLKKRLSEGSPRARLVLYLEESFHPSLHFDAQLRGSAGFWEQLRWAGGGGWRVAFASCAKATPCLASLDRTASFPSLLPEERF